MHQICRNHTHGWKRCSYEFWWYCCSGAQWLIQTLLRSIIPTTLWAPNPEPEPTPEPSLSQNQSQHLDQSPCPDPVQQPAPAREKRPTKHRWRKLCSSCCCSSRYCTDRFWSPQENAEINSRFLGRNNPMFKYFYNNTKLLFFLVSLAGALVLCQWFFFSCTCRGCWSNRSCRVENNNSDRSSHRNNRINRRSWAVLQRPKQSLQLMRR